MSTHLSPEEVSKWVTGERDPAAQRHVAECLSCGAEIERLDKLFSLFRESGVHWSECVRATPGRAEKQPIGLRWRLGIAGSLMACALSVWVIFRPAAPQAMEEPFLQIPYVVPPAAYERTAVVRSTPNALLLPTKSPSAYFSATAATTIVESAEQAITTKLATGSSKTSSSRTPSWPKATTSLTPGV